MERIILLMDLDSFYAQVEQLRNVELRGKPVAVCMFSGRTEDSGAIATANYKARELGIKSGMPISQAKALDKEKKVFFLPADRPYYKEVSDRIMDILRKHAEKFEQVSIDEAYLDVSERCAGDYEAAAEVGRLVKSEVYKQELLTCSVGIGPNRLVAKIAAGYNKPDGLTVVRSAEVEGFLGPLKVRKLPGVGPRAAWSFQKIGVATVEGLRKVNKDELLLIFGTAKGTKLWEYCRGIDNSEVFEEERKQLSRIGTLKQDAGSYEETKELLDQLCQELWERASDFGQPYKTVSIIAITGKLQAISRSKSLQKPALSLESIQRHAHDLMEEYFEERQEKLRRIGVRVSNFDVPAKGEGGLGKWLGK